jgi:hypothetical protein
MTALAGWENFYVIVGSSAGALIGLQFVVITLIAEFPIVKDVERASSAFATPTIVHFGAVLLLASIGSMPWHGIGAAAVAWGVLGVVGVIYLDLVARRMRTQEAYSPQFEDWLFHILLPFAGYAMLIGSVYAARTNVSGFGPSAFSQRSVRSAKDIFVRGVESFISFPTVAHNRFYTNQLRTAEFNRFQ